MNQKKFLGVCSWVANMLGIDARLVRVLFLIGVIFFGIGIASYFIMFIIKSLVD